MITHYLKIAWRNLWKYKVQSVVSMTGLAVCVLCFSICLYVCRLMWATDRCFPKKERIAEVVLNGPHGDFSGIPLDLLDKLRGMHSPAIEAFTYVAYPGNRSYEIEVKPDEMQPFAPLYCMEIDTCFRQVFGLEILAGSWETAARTPNAIILSESTARRMMGSPYFWGGTSTKMTDCSGLSKISYFSNGVILMRDAWQQALTGKKIAADDWRQARTGDLLFFGTRSGRVTHVAIYLDNGKYIHCSGRVKINSVDPEADDYLSTPFLSISRIDGQIGTKGITTVREHPWYFQK